MIEAKVLKGFRDFLPEQELLRRAILNRFEHVCQSFGFLPIDTPVLEYSEILLGKGESDKQLFRFTDNGKRDVAMRFDLTVPFARFIAQHAQHISLPFRRYHFAKVFRGENPQKGRYREFMQCDFDILGVDNFASDGEILQLMHSCFSSLGISDIEFHINHRALFNRFLNTLDIEDQSLAILRIVDKRNKIGQKNCADMLNECVGNLGSQILNFIHPEATNYDTLHKMEELSGGASEDSQRLGQILELADSINIKLVLNPAITRGLDYYTGIVYESYLSTLPEIGSVCSGGRYNNLAALYSRKSFAGVGASIGLDRLIAALEELEQNYIIGNTACTNVLIFMLNESCTSYCFSIAQKFRSAGFQTEVYLEQRKLQQQFAYAERKNIPIGIFAGESELQKNIVNCKNLISRESRDGITIDEAIHYAQSTLPHRASFHE